MLQHIGSTVAAFVDTVAQAPIQVQCVPPATESWTKWLLQFALSIIPVAGGVGIALWSFRATSERDHKQWIRDQSKAEWKEILLRIAELERDIPIVLTGIPEHKGLEAAVLEILPLLRGSLFVYPELDVNGFVERWESFVAYVSGPFMSAIQTNRAVQMGTVNVPVSGEDRINWMDRSTNNEIEVRKRLHSLLHELRSLARVSIKLKDVECSQSFGSKN